MIFAVALACLLLVTAAAARWGWAAEAASRALSAKDPGRVEWRVACFLARLLSPSILATVLLFLVAATLEGPLTTDRWAVGLAVVTGVLGNHVDREISSGWEPYWTQCHDSLREVLPVFVEPHEAHGSSEEDCQAVQFNIWRFTLFNRDERPFALQRIFSACAHPR